MQVTVWSINEFYFQNQDPTITQLGRKSNGRLKKKKPTFELRVTILT
jgi:hypothetical protein